MSKLDIAIDPDGTVHIPAPADPLTEAQLILLDGLDRARPKCYVRCGELSVLVVSGIPLGCIYGPTGLSAQLQRWQAKNNPTTPKPAPKYEFTDRTMQFRGVTLTQIRRADEPHVYGGWIQSAHNLSQEGECWVHQGAIVWGGARVTGNAFVTGGCIVGGRVHVDEQAHVSCNAELDGDLYIGGNTVVITKCDLERDKDRWTHEFGARVGARYSNRTKPYTYQSGLDAPACKEMKRAATDARWRNMCSEVPINSPVYLRYGPDFPF